MKKSSNSFSICLFIAYELHSCLKVASKLWPTIFLEKKCVVYWVTALANLIAISYDEKLTRERDISETATTYRIEKL